MLNDFFKKIQGGEVFYPTKPPEDIRTNSESIDLINGRLTTDGTTEEKIIMPSEQLIDKVLQTARNFGITEAKIIALEKKYEEDPDEDLMEHCLA